MDPFRTQAILVLVTISLFSCSAIQETTQYRQITLNAPNCPLAECRLRYETDPTIMIYEPESDSGDDEEINPDQDFLAVPQDEFEKDYEVR